MNSILLKVIFLTSILLFIIDQGCSEITEPAGKDYSNEIVPLAVGNQWNYSNEIYDTTGNVIWNNNATSTIIGDSTIDNIKWFYFDKNALYFSILTDGYHTYNKYETDSLRNTLAYKYPCIVGDKYSYYEVVKVDTQITVSAGTFKCIMYSYHKQTSMDFTYLDFFIKSGVGIVKIVQYDYIDNYPIFIYRISELLSYNFNK